MTLIGNPYTMAATLDAGLGPRHLTVVLVVDLVESVSLMQNDEAAVISRWRAFVAHVSRVIVPGTKGRVVKSLGDGLLLEFDSAPHGVAAALAMHAWIKSECADMRMPLALRAGLHCAEVYADEHDIYGAGVNLAARIATLAGPGETVVTSQIRDGLTDGLDGVLEDLGECYLRHIDTPVRAWRVGAAGPQPILKAVRDYTEPLHPTIAVIPFEARSNEPEHFAIGELLADGVIEQLSHSAELRVISRLSTTAFRARAAAMGQIETHLGATYVLSGTYVTSGSRLLINAELADARSNEVVRVVRLGGEVGDLLQADSELSHGIAAIVHQEILSTAVRKTLAQPLPTLASYSLMLGGITLMHRSSARDFDRSREVLDALVDRHRRAAGARAWLAKWHILRVVRGMSATPDADARLAMEQTRRALDLEPDSALALAIEGHAQCQLSGDIGEARKKIERALELNPSEPVAWLYKSVWSQMWGSSSESVGEALHARLLSPTDPLAYYFDMILAGAFAFNGQHERAIAMALRSLRLDKHQAPTLRALILAQVESGRMDDARATLQQLMQETPDLTIAKYKSMGSADSQARQRVIAALRALEVRES